MLRENTKRTNGGPSPSPTSVLVDDSNAGHQYSPTNKTKRKLPMPAAVVGAALVVLVYLVTTVASSDNNARQYQSNKEGVQKQEAKQESSFSTQLRKRSSSSDLEHCT